MRAKQSNVLSWLPLSDDERTGHLRRLVEDLALRLSQASGTTKDSGAGDFPSAAARAAISAGPHSGNACSRVANSPGDHIRDATGQSEPSGFQLAFTRRHDDRGRSGFSVDTVDGQLHESQAKVCGSLAIASYCHEHTGHLPKLVEDLVRLSQASVRTKDSDAAIPLRHSPRRATIGGVRRSHRRV